VGGFTRYLSQLSLEPLLAGEQNDREKERMEEELLAPPRPATSDYADE
jgi:hypothetical protein